MQFIQASIPDIVIVVPKVFGDQRGYFVEGFRRDLFEKHVGAIDFMQDNESMSEYGVVRGLHYQLPPYAQNKLVRVVVGRIIDIAVDIRRKSPTFGRHMAIELSGQNMHQVFIPKGFAHGFAVLSEKATVVYKVDAPYAPEYERCIRFDDTRLNIAWQLPKGDIILSEKDQKAPSFHEAELFDTLI